MEFLHSNFPPVRFGGRTFSDAFYDLLPGTESLDIAVGYITSDSLIELERLAELNNMRNVNLTIGMHYLDKFTHTQYNAALRLNRYLTESGRGQVRLVTPFRYHGKLYSYSDAMGASAGIIGSNNLGSIVEGGSRVYESAILLRDRASAREMNNESAYRLASATHIKNKVDWARYQTGDGGRTKTIVSVDHDEAIVLFWALDAYIKHVEDLIKESKDNERNKT